MVLSGPARDDVVMSTDTPQDSPVWPPQPSSPAPAPQPSSAHQPAAWSAGPQDAVQQAEPQRIWTVLSETKRRGAWQVPERLVLPVVMGDVLVDHPHESRVDDLEALAPLGLAPVDQPAEAVALECLDPAADCVRGYAVLDDLAGEHSADSRPVDAVLERELP